MKNLFILLILCSSCLFCNAQGGTWTWVKGANVINDPGNNGLVGVTNSTNYPEGKYQAGNWIDLNGNFWVFGGWDNTSSYKNDLWKYNSTTNQWTWVKGPLTSSSPGIYGTMGVPGPNNIPGARGLGMVSWTDKQGRFWLHGGIGYDASGFNGTLDDLWMYDIATNEWTWMSGSSSSSSITAVYGTLQVAATTNTPGGRQECNTAWVKSDGTLWTFGGISQLNTHLDDMWKFDIATNNWTWMSGSQGGTGTPNYGTLNVETSSNLPPARGTYTRWQDANDNFYIFGGLGGNNYRYNDVWRYNTINNRWTWVGGSSNPSDVGLYTQKCVSGNNAAPSARYENKTAQMLGCSNVFWTFGGIDVQNQTVNDLWNFNTQTNKWTWVSGSSTGPAIGSYGTLGTPLASNVPPSRWGVCMWVDPTGIVWMWGGMDRGNNKYSDMWKFVPDTSCLHAVLFVQPLTGQLSDSILCTGDSAHFTVSGGHILSVLPASGSHLTDSTHIAFQPSTTTSYAVIATGSCGVIDTFHFTLSVTTPPIAVFHFMADTIIKGHADVIVNTSSGYDTIYAFLNGQPISPVPTSLTFTQTGRNCLTIITIKNHHCVDSSTVCVFVKSDSCAPNINITLAPPQLCPGDSTFMTVSGVLSCTIFPTTGVRQVDALHAWLKPTVATVYNVVVSNLCGGLDTFAQSVSILSPPTTAISQTICAGHGIVFNGNTISSAGTYRDTLSTISGCDSFIVLTVTIHPPFVTNLGQAICNGGHVIFHGDTITTAGVYRDTLTSVMGCDSFIILTVGPTTTTAITQSICTGGSLVFNGNTISTAGVYRDTLITGTGCDSFIVLTVTILSPAASSINQAICQGDKIVFNGITISTAGIYADTLHTTAGCDSIVQLTVAVSPRPTASFSMQPVGDSIGLGIITATNNSINADTVFWSLNQQLLSLSATGILPIADTGTYCLRLVAATKQGCKDTSSFCFYVFDNAFAMPNAFTPNGDGKNDFFHPVFINKYGITINAFRVYNRWGQLIYNNDNPAQGWDGKYKGEAQPSEVYSYYISVSLPDIAHPTQLKEINKEGSFSLFR